MVVSGVCGLVIVLEGNRNPFRRFLSIWNSANNPSSSSAMHPISLSLLHSSPTNSNAGPTNTSFYGGSGSTTTTTTTTTTSAAAAAAAAAGSGAPALNASSPSPSPLKRTRQVNSERSNGGGGGAEEWLPLPSPMSVDSGSPPPPTVSAAGNNGHSTLPPSVSSNGYSPSPMSTGSYEPPYSPGGKLGKSKASTSFCSCFFFYSFFSFSSTFLTLLRSPVSLLARRHGTLSGECKTKAPMEMA